MQCINQVPQNTCYWHGSWGTCLAMYLIRKYADILTIKKLQKYVLGTDQTGHFLAFPSLRNCAGWTEFWEVWMLVKAIQGVHYGSSGTGEQPRFFVSSDRGSFSDDVLLKIHSQLFDKIAFMPV